jgi:hypothetical protein
LFYFPLFQILRLFEILINVNENIIDLNDINLFIVLLLFEKFNGKLLLEDVLKYKLLNHFFFFICIYAKIEFIKPLGPTKNNHIHQKWMIYNIHQQND